MIKELARIKEDNKMLLELPNREIEGPNTELWIVRGPSVDVRCRGKDVHSRVGWPPAAGLAG